MKWLILFGTLICSCSYDGPYDSKGREYHSKEISPEVCYKGMVFIYNRNTYGGILTQLIGMDGKPEPCEMAVEKSK